ncbi:MAG: hypothetical protein BWK73_07320 [Thiothrix lacustris]|uniref:Uncharacterized protein n=1 Tax=Thiothrix lacustris TaxID=525917 RepID=A0A1Y1QWS4_9GAMM|nr:MAG: hypothetical protein BWK73_07320 [Thiothrix lacustris]
MDFLFSLFFPLLGVLAGSWFGYSNGYKTGFHNGRAAGTNTGRVAGIRDYLRKELIESETLGERQFDAANQDIARAQQDLENLLNPPPTPANQNHSNLPTVVLTAGLLAGFLLMAFL